MACIAVGSSWEQRFSPCNDGTDTLTVDVATNACSFKPSTNSCAHAEADRCTIAGPHCCAHSIAVWCADSGLTISSSWQQRIVGLSAIRVVWREWRIAA